MRYRIILTALARDDLKHIYSRSREHYPMRAAKFRADFRNALAIIAEACDRLSGSRQIIAAGSSTHTLT